MLPRDVQFHKDVRLFVWKPRGVLGEAAHEVELNFKYIIQVSLHRRLAYAGGAPVKSAILATDATAIHYGRLRALLIQGSPIHVRVFQDHEEAAQWLSVPVEVLAMEAK
jgi:hypothetical protein